MKAIFFFVKYTPIVFGFLMLIHCICLINAYDNEILKEFFCFNWLVGVVFTILSYRLKMCYIHRLYIWYDCLMDLCIKAQRYDIFNDIGMRVQYVRYFMFVIGVLIQVLLIRRMYGCKKCK